MCLVQARFDASQRLKHSRNTDPNPLSQRVAKTVGE